MSQTFILEIADVAVGIVHRESHERLFQFHASAPALYSLDGLAFASPSEAEKVVKARLALFNLTPMRLKATMEARR